MRLGLAVAMAAAVAGAAAPAMAQGILLVTDGKPQTRDVRGCLVAARKTLSGTGTVLQTVGGSVYGSNDDRTVAIRCDIPDIVMFIDAFVPGVPDVLDPVEAAFTSDKVAGLIAARTKGHQYTVDCTRETSCEVDVASLCKQAYETSKKPAAKVMHSIPCADAKGSYTCSVEYDLDCS